MADALKAALQELVDVKALKDRMESLAHGGFQAQVTSGGGLNYEPAHTEWIKLGEEYKRRKPLAWEAGRAALSAPLSPNSNEGNLTSASAEMPTHVASVVPCYTPSGKRVALLTEYQHLPIGTKLYADPISPDGFKLQSHPTERSGEVPAAARSETER